MPAEASRFEANATASLRGEQLVRSVRGLGGRFGLERGEGACLRPPSRPSKFSLTQPASAAMASRVPVSLKLILPAGVTTASVPAVAHGVHHRVPHSRAARGCRGRRPPWRWREWARRESIASVTLLSAAHVQLPFVVDEDQSPAEVAADDESERDAVLVIRGHGAVAEACRSSSLIGAAFPAARGEGAGGRPERRGRRDQQRQQGPEP